MKKLLANLVIILLISGFNLSAQNKWMEDRDMNFKINVPTSYQSNQVWDGTDKVHAYVSPDENVAVMVRAAKVPGEATIAMLKQIFSQNIINGANELLSEVYSLNGISGEMAGYRWKYNGTQTVIGAFFTIQNDVAYIVWSIVPENLVSQRNPEADAIMNTFTLSGISSSQPSANTGSTGGLGGLGGFGQQQSQQQVGENVTITDMAIGLEADSDNQIMYPLTTIDPATPKIDMVFGYTGNAKGKTFISKWYNESNGAFIKEFSFFPPDAPSGRGHAYINNPPNGTWPAGTHRVEVWLDDTKLDEIRFEIPSSSQINTSSNSGDYVSMVSDDACVEYLAPKGFHVSSREQGQIIWENNSGIKMVQQVIFKQGDFSSFMKNQVKQIENQGASIGKFEFSSSNGLDVCQYIYEYGDSFFIYNATENNDMFLLVGFVCNKSKHNTAINYSEVLRESIKKAPCPN